MKKHLRLFSIIIFAVCQSTTNVYSDKLFIKGEDSAIEVTVVKSDLSYVTVTIQKEHITNMEVNRLNNIDFSDMLQLFNLSRAIYCEISEIDNNSVQAKIPMSEIASFNITLHKPEIDQDEIQYVREYNKMDNNRFTEEFKNKNRAQNRAILSNEKGALTGSVLHKEKPLPKCEIKIYRLEPARGLFSRNFKLAEYFETMTDNEGRYSFNDLRPGPYKLYWKRNIGDEWKRKIELEPDAIVEIGQKTFAPILDIDKGFLNHTNANY